MQICSVCTLRQPLVDNICHMISKSDGKGVKHKTKCITVMPFEHYFSYREGMEVHVCASSLCMSKLDHVASHCNSSSSSEVG